MKKRVVVGELGSIYLRIGRLGDIRNLYVRRRQYKKNCMLCKFEDRKLGDTRSHCG